MTETDTARPAQQSATSWFRLPEPLRRVFARFPLVNYTANDLPQTAPQQRNHHVFYSFQRRETPLEQPSCNPTCLKWQALLNFQGVQYRVQTSNNHASPSGALPFVLPAPTQNQRPSSPVSANKIPRWIVSQGGIEEKVHLKEEAYTALIDHDIRNAWLYFLYLDASNFEHVAWPLYCESASSNYLVQQALARQLQSAARDELLKSYNLIDADELFKQAEAAFSALSILLAENDYFYGVTQPGLFDASVFAYTHLLLDEGMKWQNSALAKLLKGQPKLVSHRERLLSKYFP
jgi:metaxin